MLARGAAALLRHGQKAEVALNVARSFASAAEFKLPAAPLQLSGTAANVATLTWQISVKNNTMEQVQDELQQLAEAFRSLPELTRLATDPFVPAIVRKKVVDSVLKDSKATDVTKRLMEALADENGLSGIVQISKSFDELVLAHKKEVYVTIVSAHPLDKLEKAEIRKQAEKFVEPGFKLVTKEKVEKKLLGGFILEFEDRLVDLSTAKKISEFNETVARLEREA